MAYGGLYLGSAAAGGYFTNPRLNKKLWHALLPVMKFRQFVDIREAIGKGRGDTVYYDKVSRANTAGGTLNETDEIPERKFVISRGTVVISEWGNAIAYTLKLETLSEFDLSDSVNKVLRDDIAITLDKACGKQFKLTRVKYTGVSTAAGSFEVIAAGKTMGSGYNVKGGWRMAHIRDCVKHLKANLVPPYDENGNYICIASVNFLAELMKDSEWQTNVRYGDPERLFTGEVGRCYGVRFIEESNYLSNTIGSGGNYGEAVIFGAEAVVEATALEPELRVKVPTDYGRSKGTAWYALMGFKKFWNYADTGQYEHIIHLTGKS